MGHAKEQILGDPKDSSNVFQWEEVRLNLPGMAEYDPFKALVDKVREDGRVAADLFIYMEDFRPTDPDAEEYWRDSRRAARICNHLGIQDAPRKRRGVSRSPGPWSGSMMYTDEADAGVRVLVSRKKWYKANQLLANLHGLVLASEWVDHKVLERIRGFSVYVARTYKPITHFIMGLHMTIDGWRPGRDEEGWILREAERAASRESDEEGGSEEPPPLGPLQPPGLVKAATILLPDLEVMFMLTEAEDPPLRKVRAKSKINTLYCCGDASGSGLGWCIDLGRGVRYELGEWCESIQEATSNYRELRNLVNAMVQAAQEGRLDGCEVFLYTENQTSEGAYRKGTAGS
jgi:hypothetical protein